MSGDAAEKRFSVKRWSQRKLEASRAAREVPQPDPIVPPPGVAPLVPEAAQVPAPAPTGEPELPPIQSLSFDSDFAAFMQPKVAEGLRRQALKTLFRDPRFNVMDGLDVYIDDYSIPSPVEPELVREMLHARYLFDPPKTRVNAQGWVEDVPPEEAPTALESQTTEPASPEPAALAPPQEPALAPAPEPALAPSPSSAAPVGIGRDADPTRSAS